MGLEPLSRTQRAPPSLLQPREAVAEDDPPRTRRGLPRACPAHALALTFRPPEPENLVFVYDLSSQWPRPTYPQPPSPAVAAGPGPHRASGRPQACLLAPP